MNPGTYTQKLPTVTACQWDATAEAQTFILAAYGSTAHVVDQDIEVQGPVHPYTLAQGTWIVVDPAQPAPQELTDEQFSAQYEVKP